jgi:ribonuclease HI
VTKENDKPVRIYTDGGSRGNPGPAAYGFVIFDTKGEVLKEEGRYIGIATNNQAEYRGIVAALEYAKEHTIVSPIQCHLDSELVVRQINGVYRLKNEALRPHFLKVQQLVRSFSNQVTFHHVPRSENAYADRLVNQALDGNDNG